MERWWSILKRWVAVQLAIVLTIATVGCRDRGVAADGQGARLAAQTKPEVVISEVSPPKAIQELRPFLEMYHPQVTIRSPQPDAILEDNTVTVQLQVEDLPIFQDPKFGLGPHLHVILDNQPYTTVYDLDRPLVLSDLSPGTHTLRVFAARPWFESFKNEGAYAQTTFHVYTPSDENTPQSTLPLLTYNQPQGSYGAEPILLDFYLSDAPLHAIAQQSKEDDIQDWQIRCTVDGKSFIIDRWQALYLQGFQPGQNWVKLEFLDELGNPVNNAFNQTIRIVTYQPGTEDALSKLIAGKLSLEEVRGIVDPHYIYEEETPPLTPRIEPTPEAIEEPATLPEILEEPMTLPETLEEPMEEPATLPEILEEPITLPETLEEPMEEPATLPEILEDPLEEPATLPEILEDPLEEPATLPEILEEPITLPETLEKPIEEPATLPEILEEPMTLPETLEKPITLPEPQFPEDLSVPIADPESLEPPEWTLEDSEEEVLLEEENRSDRTDSDEIEVPPQENSPSELVPQQTQDPLPELELAPLESQEEAAVEFPETQGLDEILPDSQAPDVVEPIEVQIQLDPTTLENILESDPSFSPTLKAIETPELASPTPPTATPLQLEVEAAQSHS